MDMNPESQRQAGQYWAVLSGLLPVFIIGGLVAMTTNLRKIYTLPSKQRMAVELIMTGMIGGVAALVAVALLPLMWDGSTPTMEIAIAALAGSYGQKTFDLLRLKLLGPGDGNNGFAN
jgi:thiosulfate reductase cytochrome b subunit